jgi:hypothetical protein
MLTTFPIPDSFDTLDIAPSERSRLLSQHQKAPGIMARWMDCRPPEGASEDAWTAGRSEGLRVIANSWPRYVV